VSLPLISDYWTHISPTKHPHCVYYAGDTQSHTSDFCRSTFVAQQCWATNVERFSMSHIRFLSLNFVAQLCRSTFVAQQKSLNISLIWATKVARMVPCDWSTRLDQSHSSCLHHGDGVDEGRCWTK